MVLAAASEYFLKMFTIDMKEKNQNEVKIKLVTGDSLKLLVDFCYTGQIEINSKNIMDLLAATTMFRFEKIQEKCANFLRKQLFANSKTSLYILLIAEMYSFTELAQESLRILCKHFSIVSKLPYFNEIDFDCLKQILDNDEYFDVNERQIFEAAMEWVDYNRSERETLIPNILKLIRLTQISPTVEYRFI